MPPEDIAALGLGSLAFALGLGGIVGVLQPDGAMAANLPVLVFGALLAGVAGLFIGPTRGWGRRASLVGTSVALIAVLVFGGDVAINLLLEV